MPKRQRILVVGGGPAGLSAATHLLEQAPGSVQVELLTADALLGGRAASWEDERGYTIEHGLHAVFGFYRELRSLAQRAGVDVSTALRRSGGIAHLFDEERRALYTLSLSRNPLTTLKRLAEVPGLSTSERLRVLSALVRVRLSTLRAHSLESQDALDFRALLERHGAPEAFFHHPLYRQLSELFYNRPHALSAYTALRGAQLLTQGFEEAEVSYPAGGLTELFWNPIAKRIERLGGALRTGLRLVELEHASSRLVAARFQTQGGELREAGFHALVCAIPSGCFAQLNPGDALWSEPFFQRITRLASVSTVSVQLWLEDRVPIPPGAVNGLAAPLSSAIDHKPLSPRLSSDDRFGAALQWVGAETGFEALSDEALVQRARASLARLPGLDVVARSRVVHQVVRRNRAPAERFLLPSPGSLQHRPSCQTPLRGLFLAGDWVRNEVDLPLVEGAVRSGKEAAAAVLRSL